MLEWFERVGYSAGIAGLERESAARSRSSLSAAPPRAAEWARRDPGGYWAPERATCGGIH